MLKHVCIWLLAASACGGEVRREALEDRCGYVTAGRCFFLSVDADCSSRLGQCAFATSTHVHVCREPDPCEEPAPLECVDLCN
jgi:hypothetical protein